MEHAREVLGSHPHKPRERWHSLTRRGFVWLCPRGLRAARSSTPPLPVHPARPLRTLYRRRLPVLGPSVVPAVLPPSPPPYRVARRSGRTRLATDRLRKHHARAPVQRKLLAEPCPWPPVRAHPGCPARAVGLSPCARAARPGSSDRL